MFDTLDLDDFSFLLADSLKHTRKHHQVYSQILSVSVWVSAKPLEDREKLILKFLASDQF